MTRKTGTTKKSLVR